MGFSYSKKTRRDVHAGVALGHGHATTVGPRAPAWYDTTPAILARLGWFVLLFLAVLLGYPLAAVLRRRRRAASDAATPRRLRLLLWGSSAINFAFLVGVVWIFAGRQFLYSVSPVMVAIFSLPLIALALTGLALYETARQKMSERPSTRLFRWVVLGTLVLFPCSSHAGICSGSTSSRRSEKTMRLILKRHAVGPVVLALDLLESAQAGVVVALEQPLAYASVLVFVGEVDEGAFGAVGQLVPEAKPPIGVVPRRPGRRSTRLGSAACRSCFSMGRRSCPSRAPARWNRGRPCRAS